ncbi:MAG: histidinol dehydrogenase [Planctomycetaceae bacterium]|nr:histidinol dehydrogenase [Planctomycetaceae bacterium]
MSLNIRRIATAEDDSLTALDELRARLSPRGDIVSEAGRRKTLEVFGEALAPRQVVERICGDVRTRGLSALLEYTTKLDGSQLTTASMRVSSEELAAAHKAVELEFLSAVRRIRKNILEFQSAILHKDVRLERPYGSYLRQRYLPLSRVGLCVPGGAASYPSTVLMTAVPAQAAGVPEIAVVAPPTKFGADSPYIRALCHELGITELYRIGGAQGVAALAYGVEGIKRVDKIVGPGNLFVALAKQHVFGDVDIDSIAGPSEVVVVADELADPRFLAADMLAQAEHSPGSSILITWDAEVLSATKDELESQLAGLERGDLARAALEEYGLMILAADEDEACKLADLIAPEHLHIDTTDPEAVLDKIPHAGAAFLGRYSPVAVGDYAAGPSHVLPTGGTARFASGLCANDFLRRTSVISMTRDGLADLSGEVRTVANVEGLTAHRESVEIRLQDSSVERRGGRA